MLPTFLTGLALRYATATVDPTFPCCLSRVERSKAGATGADLRQPFDCPPSFPGTRFRLTVILFHRHPIRLRYSFVDAVSSWNLVIQMLWLMLLTPPDGHQAICHFRPYTTITHSCPLSEHGNERLASTAQEKQFTLRTGRDHPHSVQANRSVVSFQASLGSGQRHRASPGVLKKQRCQEYPPSCHEGPGKGG